MYKLNQSESICHLSFATYGQLLFDWMDGLDWIDGWIFENLWSYQTWIFYINFSVSCYSHVLHEKMYKFARWPISSTLFWVEFLKQS